MISSHQSVASAWLAGSVVFTKRRGVAHLRHKESDRLAAVGEVDRLVVHLVERLDAAGFFFPPEKRASMTASLDNLFRRAPLTDADVRTLHGVLRALAAGGK